MNVFLIIVGGLAMWFIATLVGALIFGFPLMLFWNASVPAIFGLPELGYFQAAGLLATAGLLFGSNKGGK